MSDKKASTVKKLSALRDNFQLTLEQKLNEISTLIEKLNLSESQCQNVDILIQLQKLLHRLAGSSGTFGLDKISKIVREEEEICFKAINDAYGLNKKTILNLKNLHLSITNLALGRGTPIRRKNGNWDLLVHAREDRGEVKNEIVLITDDELLTEALQDRLDCFDYKLNMIVPSETLNDRLKQISPIAIIIDIDFPIDQKSYLNDIKKLRTQKILNCAIIFISDRSDVSARLHAVSLGADAYLLKPVDIVELIEFLNKLTNSEKMSGYRVLIVDNDESAEINKTQLLYGELSGITLTEPLNILDTLEEIKPDVILINMDMKGSGYSSIELAKLIRLDSKYVQTPIICLSSAYRADDIMAAFDSGGDEFLKKSGPPKEIRASILALAKRSREFANLANKLRKSENNFRAVAQTAKDAIITVDTKGRIIYWNDAAKNMFGFEYQEIVGSNFSQLIPPRYKKIIVNAFERLVIYKQPINHKNSIDFQALNKQGTSFPVELTYSYWPSGNKVYFTGIIRDIRERKKYENALKESKKEADRANMAKSEFLSNMSHELRTPLNAILGFSQLLGDGKKSKLNKKQSCQVDEITKGGQHLLELVNDILELSKIEAGELALNIKKVNIQNIIEECLPLIDSIANKRNIHIKAQIQCANPFVKADYIRTKQAILNLLTNAIKYNKPAGRVELSIDYEGDNYLKIKVSDTGYGISKAKQAELFQPFNRLGAEHTDIEGTGIGLILTRQLIENMGGNMGFWSRKDKGSTFWVKLPLAIVQQSPDFEITCPTMQTDKQSFEQYPQKGTVVNAVDEHTKITKKLLYIEDNQANLTLIETMIEREKNIQMLSAKTAEIGVEIACRELPDIILMDINLPGMDGFEALKRLQENVNTRSIPVLALSANVMAKSKKRGLDAGFKAYFDKPVDLQELGHKIEEVLHLN